MRGLSAGFLQAHERSWRNMNEGQEDVYGFGTTERPAHLGQLPHPVSDEAYPTHCDTLTLRLTPERFQQLARALSALLDEAQAEGVREEGTACTLAVLAFQAEPSQPKQLIRIPAILLSFEKAPKANSILESVLFPTPAGRVEQLCNNCSTGICISRNQDSFLGWPPVEARSF